MSGESNPRSARGRGYEGKTYKQSQPQKPLGVVANGYTAFPPTSDQGLTSSNVIVPQTRTQVLYMGAHNGTEAVNALDESHRFRRPVIR